jgi:iron complex transport system substrate-binding protein
MFRRTLLLAALAATAFAAGPAGAREITHAMGVTDVPDAPKRVVVLTNEGTEALLAVGITPVGAVRSFLGDPWYPHLGNALDGVEVVGAESAVNLEVIAALEPDLIVGNKQRQEKIYDQLSAIAPTVLSERLRGDWRINLELYSDAAGKGAEGKAALAAFDARVAKLAATLGSRTSDQISLVRFMPNLTRIYYNDTFAGGILKQLGFKRPAAQDKPDFADDVGKERISEFEGDRLFYFVYETGNGDADKQAATWTAEPLWQNLAVVKAGKVEKVDDAVWNTAGGIIAANLLVSDIARAYGVEAP